MPRLGARLVIAGTHSGVGKTTVSTGLMAALAARGMRVASAKVGPDFIDPGYHAVATGRPGRNLDAWISGSQAIAPLAARAAAGADVLVVEGVMGLFDGAAEEPGTDGAGAGDAGTVGAGERGVGRALPPASTAHVAALLASPVVLVVDASAMSGSVAALVHGYRSFSADVDVAGVICNRVGSDGHAAMLAEALAPLGLPLLGMLRRDDAFSWRDRHLGLVPVAEQADVVAASVASLAATIERHCDVAAILDLARSAPAIDTDLLPATTRRAETPVRVAVGTAPAFGFVYPENLERLEEAGAELVPLDPTRDESLPADVDGLYLGGGFPEVFAAALSENAALLADIRREVASGLVTWAECGGLLFLCESLDGKPLCGAIQARATMTDRLTLGYRRALVRAANPVAPAGEVLRGHEFHYSAIDPTGTALELAGRFGTGAAGFATPTLLASYLHCHLGAHPAPAERFVATVARRRQTPDSWPGVHRGRGDRRSDVREGATPPAR